MQPQQFRLITHPVFWVVLASCVYLTSLGTPFVLDDAAIIRDNVNVRQLASVKYFLTKQYFARFAENAYRPVPTLSYVLNYHWWGSNSFGYHLTNFILHSGCSVLVYLIAASLYGSFAGFAAGVIFAMHPAVAETVSVASFNEDLFATLFLLLSFYFYMSLRGRLGDRGNLIISIVIAILSYILALLSKETVLVLPLIIIAYHICFKIPILCHSEPQAKNLIQKHVLVFVITLYSIATILYLLLRFHWIVNPQELSFTYIGNSFYANALTMIKTLPHYARALFWPFGYGAVAKFKYFDIAYSLLDKEVIISSLFVIICITGVLLLLKRHKNYVFGPLLIIISFLPLMNLIPSFGMYLMADRYLYMPTVGAALTLSLMFNSLANIFSKVIQNSSFTSSFPNVPRLRHSGAGLIGNQNLIVRSFPNALIGNPIIPGLIFCAWLVATGLASQNRIATAERPTGEAEHALKVNPSNPTALLYLGSAYIAKGEYMNGADAMVKGMHGLNLTGGIAVLDTFIFHLNAGQAYAWVKQHDKALVELNAALYLNPKDSEANHIKGVILERIGNREEGMKYLEQATKLSRTNAEAEAALARYYFATNEWNKAMEHIEQAIWLKPDKAEYFTLLGHIYTKKNQLHRAIPAYRAALSLEPQNSQNYIGLGWALLKSTQPAQALGVFRTLILVERPRSPGGYYGLASAASALGKTKLAISALQKAVTMGFSDINAIKQNEFLKPLSGQQAYKDIVASLLKEKTK